MQEVNLSASDSLATVTEDVTSTAQSYDNFTQIEATNTTLAGLPAFKIVYAATVDGGSVERKALLDTKDLVA